MNLIFINPYAFTTPAAPSGFSDNFDRADGALGSSWTVWDGIIAIEANKAEANVLDGAAWNADTPTLNQYSRATVSKDAGHSNFSRFGPAVRMSADGGSYYVASIRPNDGRLYVDRVVNGAQSAQVATVNSVGWADGKIIEIRATANGANVDLEVVVDGVSKWSGTETTSVLTGPRVGIGSAAAGNNGYIDDWYGGSL